MLDIRRILCPTDLSDASRLALGHACALARWRGAQVTLLYVGPVLHEEEERQQLDRFIASAHVTGCRVSTAIRSGSPLLEIVRAAERLPADLVVMGTHAHQGLDRLTGSVAEGVLHHTTRPVLVVPPASREARTGGPPFTRLLCAVDFSDASLRALQYGAAVAAEAGAELMPLQVIPDASEPAGDIATAEQLGHRADDAKARLRGAIPPELAAHCRFHEILRFGKPRDEILRTADEEHVDLIVMGADEKDALRRLVFGSETDRVARSAACPVLTLRAA